MPSKESNAASSGRGAAFTSGTGKDPFTPSYTEGLKAVGQALPGIVVDAAKNEVNKAKTNPGNYVQRLAGHAFNVAADAGEAAVNTAGGFGNTALTQAQNRGQDVLAGFTNWAGSVAGYNPRIDASSKYKDVNPIPRVTAPKVDTTPGNKVWKGGDAQYRPAVGTPQSLGVYVPNDPIESVNRTFEAAGTALLPVGGFVTKPVTTAAKTTLTTTAKGAAKAGKAAAATPAGQAAARAGAATADVVSGATKAAVQGAGRKVATPIAVGSLLLTGTAAPAKASIKPAISASQAIKNAERATKEALDTVKLPEEAPRPSSIPDAAGSKIKADSGVDDVKHTKAKHILDNLSKADSIAPAVAQDQVQASAFADGTTSGTKYSKGKPNSKPKGKTRPRTDLDLPDISVGKQDVKLQRIN